MDSTPGVVSTANSLSQVRACRPCAYFKTKCIKHQDNKISKCERCHRLNKACDAQVPVPRKARKRKPTRTAQLEGKLDDIVSLLRSGQHTTTRQARATGFPTSSKSSEQHSSEITTDSGLHSHLPWHSQSVVLPGPPSNVPEVAQLPATIPLDQNDVQTERFIEIFKTHMSPQFPFVIAPAHISAHELEKEKPFLYHAIVVVVSCKDVAKQTILRKDFMAGLCEKVLIQNKKSLDILQGLLIFIAWYHYHLPIPQLTNLIQLASALTLDLGLDRPPKGPESHEILIEETKCRSMRLVIRERQMDERRAFLGLYWLVSMLSAYTGVVPIKDTPYLEECCQVLTESKEAQTDAYLVNLVRLQMIVERIRPVCSPADGIDQPLSMYIQMIHREMQIFKQNLPSEVGQNKVFLSYYYSAEIFLFELGFRKSGDTRSADHTLRQTRLLHSCLESVKSFLDAYFSIPPTTYFTLTFGLFTASSHAVTALSKLTLFEHDCWDLSHVRQVLSLSEVLQQLAERFEEAGNGFEVDPLTLQHNDSFSRVARKIRRINAWLDCRQSWKHSQESPQEIDAKSLGVMNDGIAEMQFDPSDEAFWLDVMNDWETL